MHLDPEFTRAHRNGRPMWLHVPTGRHVPVIAGGSDDGGAGDGGDGGDQGGEGKGGEGFKPITSQEDFDARLKDRLARERSKFADYDDLKAKAAKLDEIEEANKSEIEKANDRATKAEKAAAEAAAEALRLRVATKHGITDSDDIALFLTGTDEDTLTKQAQRLGERTSGRKRKNNHVPNEGTTPPVADDDERTAVRELFGGG